MNTNLELYLLNVNKPTLLNHSILEKSTTFRNLNYPKKKFLQNKITKSQVDSSFLIRFFFNFSIDAKEQFNWQTSITSTNNQLLIS
jgi:hypothetical protein